MHLSALFRSALVLAVTSSATHALAQDSGTGTDAVDGLRVTELVICRNIEDGQPVEPTATFRTSDGRVSVLIRVENSTGAETDISVAFERADREPEATTSPRGVVLHIPVQRRPYRTQARTGTRAAGRYRVVVRSAEGNVLQTAEYEVTAS